ncbi:acetate--CoA ligase family protein [Streptomyces sp. B-S-A8]|uniref:Acetate--CoA ligase family protein n=1 Tax=Streptomyces solicavernae TaxID=3043614 RepID=A0ABT6RP69_9ACTN|nr:acetate--CoA ligase family protein [Streptomyces sp. B-S-A8]MDI3386234.1 acetate--CoA ligase family protein [Streptomyces sp. B-S-A8]
MSDPLDALFFPRRIGVIGLSARPGTWGRRVVELLRSGGYPGEVFAVEPREPDPELPSLDDLLADGGLLDLLVVAVPAEAAVGVVERARRAGVGAVVLFSAGFAEAGAEGRLLQKRLVAAAGDLPVLGPNCLGLVSRPAATTVTASAYVERAAPAPGPVAIVTQSGAMGFVLAALLDQRGTSYAYYASVGNEACLPLTAVGSYLLERPDVQVLGLYVEQIRDPQALARLGRRARELGKRVVVLKAGASEAGGRATLSHTAAVAGDPLLFGALCRDAGIVTAADDESFADLVTALQRPVSLPPAPRFAVLSMSGGAGAVIADRLTALGARVPELTPGTRAAVAALDLPGAAALDNPIDLGGQFYRGADSFGALLAALDRDPAVDGIVCCFTFGDQFVDLYRQLAGCIGELTTPGWLVWACPPDGAPVGAPSGVVHPTIASLMRALPAVVREPEPELTDQRAPLDAKAAAARVAARLPRGPGVVTEACAGPLLRELGVPYVERVGDAGTAQPRDGDTPSLSYAVKLDSPDAPHRARLGLVRLGVPAAETALVAAELLDRAAELRLRDAQVVVQPRLTHTAELSVGAVRDPQYGPALVVGPGGARAEEAGAERQVVRLPAAPGAVERAAESVAAGHPALHASAVAQVLIRVAELVTQAPSLAELDINPLLVRPDGSLVAVDSLLVLSADDTPVPVRP